MSKYLITLTPCGRYFFGGNMVFKIEGQKEDTQFSSYIIESQKMPQQTSLLGMLRFLILSSDKEAFDVERDKISQIDKANQLIGKRSFQINNEGTANSFGLIQKIGPCFLRYREKEVCESYFRAPFDSMFQSVQFPQAQAQKAYLNGQEIIIPELKMSDDRLFTGKDGLEKPFMAIQKDGAWDRTKTLSEDELFLKDARVGVSLSDNGHVEEDHFYKQIFYRLKKGFCFAFEADIDDAFDGTLMSGQLVKLGADASMFRIQIERVEQLVYPQDKPSDTLHVTLMSHSYLPRQMEEVSYAVTDIQPFGALKYENSQDAAQYYNRGVTAKTDSLELYSAGSVFYFENEDQKNSFIKRLKGREDFRQIGYNLYYNEPQENNN